MGLANLNPSRALPPTTCLRDLWQGSVPHFLSIPARWETSLDSTEPHQHSPKTRGRSSDLCVTPTRNAQAVSACKHCCAGSYIPCSTRRARLTLVQAPNLTLQLQSSAVAAANTPTKRVHPCNSLLLRHSKRQMHGHLCRCHDVSGVAYTTPLAPSSIDECADNRRRWYSS